MPLKEQRIKKKLTQEKLAEISGVSIRAIQNYEQGVRSIDNAKIKIICSLALALGCTVFDLIDDKILKSKLKKAIKKRGIF